MTTGQLVAVGFLALTVVLVLWNIRGHPRGGDGSEKPDGIGNPGSDGGFGD